MADKKLTYILELDDDQFKKVAKQAGLSTKELDKAIVKTGDDSKKTFKTMVIGVTAFAAAVTAGVVVLKTMVSASEKYVQAFGVQEKAEQRVRSVLGKNIKSYTDYASAIQKVTTTGDEQVLNLQALAGSFGVLPEEINKTVERAIGLAKAFEVAGLSQEVALKGLAGNISVLTRYIPALKGVKDEQEQINILNEAAGKGFKIAKDEAETYAGQLQQLRNVSGDLEESIGKILIPLVIGITKEFNKWTSAVVEVLDLFEDVEDKIDSVTQEAIAQQAEFDRLTGSYLVLKEQTKLTAAEQEAMSDIIAEIQKQFPDYLKNIDLEKVGYEKAKKAIEDANQALTNNLILKIKETETLQLRERDIKLRLEEKSIVRELAEVEAAYIKIKKDNNLTEIQAQELIKERLNLQYGKVLEGEEKAAFDLQTSLSALSKRLVLNNDAIDDNLKKQEENRAELNLTAAEYDSLIEKTGGLTDGYNDLSEAARQAARDISAISEAAAAAAEKQAEAIDKTTEKRTESTETEKEQNLDRTIRLVSQHEGEIERAGELAQAEDDAIRLKRDLRQEDNLQLLTDSQLVADSLIANTQRILDSDKSASEKGVEFAKVAAKEIIEILARKAAAAAFESTFENVPVPLSFVLAPLAGAAAYGLVSSIATLFEDGGGMTTGPSHAQNGTKFVTRSQPGVIKEYEGGEYILSRNTVQRIGKENLDQINFQGKYFIQSPKFQNGGSATLSSSSPQTGQAATYTTVIQLDSETIATATNTANNNSTGSGAILTENN